ncbi:MAG TPA: hypothetical protein EYN54_04695 [Methylococcaceae bacterium]|nr:hypothetical protein [Methylococcaceae bacterium]
MAERIPLPIPLGFYEAVSPPLASNTCVNWLPIIPEAAALNNSALIQREGLAQFGLGGDGACRGGDTLAGVPFFVNGSRLVSVDSNGSSVDRGIISGSGRVSLANNGTELVIVVPGGDAFVWTGTSLVQITDPDYQTSDTVSFYRGFFVFTTTDGKQLFVSNLSAPLTFSGLDFGSAEGDPDRIVTQVLDHDELSIIGERTTEVFKLVGGVGFPLAIIPGAYTEKGSAAKFGVVKFDNSYLFIGGGVNEQPAIWRQASSSNAVKVSTDAIDLAMQKFTKEEIAEAFAMTYSQRGQFLAVFTINSTRIPSVTFVYNSTATALSGQRVWSTFQTGVNLNSWRVSAIVKAYGKFLCGDAIDERIGELDAEIFTDYEDTLFRQCTLQPFSNNGTTIFEGEFEAGFEAGVGLTGKDSPMIAMEYSNDGARTFKYKTARDIGKIGEYGHRSVWKRQGSFPVSRIIRLTVTDPVKANLNRLAATPEIGVD